MRKCENPSIINAFNKHFLEVHFLSLRRKRKEKEEKEEEKKGFLLISSFFRS